MDDRANTIAGWVLGAGIVFLGAWLVTGEIFHEGRPETMGYPVKGVTGVSKEGPAEQPIAHFLQGADASRGEATFRKCSGCHTVTQGGANGNGPNLWGRMGAPIASVPGYSYSEALRARASETWTWDNMSAWLANPRAFAQGTKMGFAGLGDPQERANLLLYLNQQGSSLPLPAAPAEASPEQNAALEVDSPAQGDMARPQAVPNQSQEQGGRTGGPASPAAGDGDRPNPKGH
ncbi:c-type cytochrome [Allosphingosinicella sp.]|jgi:cytochrome c|uniref:c-type cytochrome n=1 Tax=Allosphingosinicella sp. TaxID=2823234 RepID=UPI002F108574